MKASIAIAALFISGAVFIGCDKKDTTTVTTPDGKTTTITTPASPDTSKATDTATKAADAVKKETNKGIDAIKDAMPTTMPTLPK